MPSTSLNQTNSNTSFSPYPTLNYKDTESISLFCVISDFKSILLPSFTSTSRNYFSFNPNTDCSGTECISNVKFRDKCQKF